MKLFRSLTAVVLAGLILAPSAAFADRKIKVRRDLDGDGHFNTKTYKIDRHRGHHHHRGHYGGRYGGHYGSSYWGRNYYSYRPYYVRPHGYYGYPRTGLSFSYVSRPRVYSSTVYRGSVASYQDNLVVDVQRELRRRGYYRGSIDGDAGPQTRAAIRSYQADRGLSVTGRIDSRLVRSLGVG